MDFRFLWMALSAMLYSAAACGEEPRIPAETHVSVTISQAGEVYTVTATIDAPVTIKTAWEVLTDFDHMAAFSTNLTSSKVVSRQENTLIVKQDGVAKYGLFSFSYQSEREIHLEPMKHITSRNLSGTAKRMESETQLSQASQGQGVQIKYRAEIVPDSALARMFGASSLQRQVEEQFQAMAAEMKRREPDQPKVAAAQAQKAGD